MSWIYASSVSARPGESVSGDAVYARVSGQVALFALIDGLGHGKAAHEVATLALGALEALPIGIDAATALEALHARLHGTRGAAATLISLHGALAQVVGVGNVSCRALGAALSFVPSAGVLGIRKRSAGLAQATFSSGQRLLLQSDGISHRFDLRSLSGYPPPAACEWILRHHRHPHDDASVLIIDVGHLGEVSR